MSKIVSQKMFQVGSATKAAMLYIQERRRRQGEPHTCSTRANLEPGWLEVQGEAFTVIDDQGQVQEALTTACCVILLVR